MFSTEELKRYSRHIIMPEVGLKGQEKLKNAKVLVIGAGGLGCPVLQYLTAAGVGTIGVLDFDVVSESNLHRQILFTDNDLGKPKASIAIQKLALLNPYITFNLHQVRIEKSNALEIIKAYDVIVDGTDNFSTRYLVNDACVILNKPLVFGALYKFLGQVSVFNYKNGPTYRCLFPEQPADDEVPNCSAIGVLGVIPGIIGSMQANETIKVILEKGEVLSGKLFQIDALNFRTEIIAFNRDPEVANITKLGDYNTYCAIDETEEIKQILPAELYQKLENDEDILLYDVRNPENFKSHHIDARLISVEELFDEPKILPKNKPVVFMCEIGEKSLAVIEYLQKAHQFKNLYNLKGGIQQWMADGLDVISD